MHKASLPKAEAVELPGAKLPAARGLEHSAIFSVAVEGHHRNVHGGADGAPRSKAELRGSSCATWERGSKRARFLTVLSF